jgi:hypothetical protein
MGSPGRRVQSKADWLKGVKAEAKARHRDCRGKEDGSYSEKRFVDMRTTEVEIGEGRRERRKREERARVLREQAPVIDAIVTKVAP